jgi:hypothetical protein
MRKLALLTLGLALASPAWAEKDALVVDLVADVATMDPQLQWMPTANEAFFIMDMKWQR